MSLFPKVNWKVEAGRFSSCQNCFPRRAENADRGVTTVKGKYGSSAGGAQGCYGEYLMSSLAHLFASSTYWVAKWIWTKSGAKLGFNSKNWNMLLKQKEDNTGVLIFPLLPKLAETMIFSQLEKTSVYALSLLFFQIMLIPLETQRLCWWWTFFLLLNLSKLFNAGPNF